MEDEEDAGGGLHPCGCAESAQQKREEDRCGDVPGEVGDVEEERLHAGVGEVGRGVQGGVVGEPVVEHEGNRDERAVEIARAASEGMLILLKELDNLARILHVLVEEDGGGVVPDPGTVEGVCVGDAAQHGQQERERGVICRFQHGLGPFLWGRVGIS